MNRFNRCGTRSPAGSRRLRRRAALALAVGLAVGGAGMAGEGGPKTPTRGVAKAQDAPARRYLAYLPIVAPPEPAIAPIRPSHPRGFYDAPFDLLLASDTPGAVIRYTLDGTLPAENHGLVYTGPIGIATTTTLRAIATRPGFAPSAVETHTYIVIADVLRQPPQPDPARYPGAWGRYPNGRLAGELVAADYAMDPKVTEHPLYRDSLPNDLRAVPSLSLLTTPDDMFGAAGIFGGGEGIYANPMQEGSEWERPASIELLYPDGRPGFQIDGGVRIAGQWSRKPDVTAKHSFSLRFRKRYGAGHLEYPLFADTSVDRFDTLRLRGGQADSFHYWPLKAQYVHDEWGRDTERDMGWLSPHGRFVHLYVNGLYWGLYNLTEEVTAAFAAAHLGGDEEDYDVIKGEELQVPDGRGGTRPVASFAVEDGEAAAFEALLAIPPAGPAADPALYERMAGMLDIPRFIDHTLVEVYGANDDWVNKNWRAIRRRGPGEKFEFMAWDIERMTQLRDLDAACGSAAQPGCGNIASTAGVMGLHGWLKGNPDYRLAFADRVRRHFGPGGALSPQRAGARYAALAGQIDRAIVGESARWGDVEPGERTRNEQYDFWSLFWRFNGQGAPQLRDPHWVHERDRLLAEFFPGRTGIVLQQLCDAGLYPPVVAPRLAAQAGRGKSSLVTMELDTEGYRCAGARGEGRLYFTTDGRDPRRPGTGDPALPWSGQPAPGARVYQGPQSISGYRQVQARLAVPEGDGWMWGPLASISVGTPRLAFGELMYHPPEGEAEFIELWNLESRPVDLSGATLDGVRATLAAGTVVEAGGAIVLAADAAAFWRDHPGVPLAATFDGSLANGGETISLRDAAGQVLAQVSYHDDGFWPLSPDGLGWSLVLADVAADPTDPERWRASSRPGGSPGAADPPPPYAEPRINEVLANAAPPLEGAIELVNPGSQPADIGGWFLSDDRAEPRKFRIPEGTVLLGGGLAVFYAADLHTGGSRPLPADGPEAVIVDSENAAGEMARSDAAVAGSDGTLPEAPSGGGIGGGFTLNPDGGQVVLSSAGLRGGLTGLMRGVSYGPADAGMSFGRYRSSVGPEFVMQAVHTFGRDAPATVEEFRSGTGGPNAGPLVGPVVISEVMYHPRPGGDEYIELENLSDVDVPLYDVHAPMRTWRMSSGVAYTFPLGTAIPRRGRILVVSVEPRWFLANPANRPVPRGTLILGPFIGHLGEPDDTLVLARPGTSPAGGATWIEVDRLDYGSRPPWFELADGLGPSLERRQSGRFGNDPANWLALAAGGTPGGLNTLPVRVFLPFSLVDGVD